MKTGKAGTLALLYVYVSRLKGESDGYKDVLKIVSALYYLQGYHLKYFGTPAFPEAIIREKGYFRIDDPFFDGLWTDVEIDEAIKNEEKSFDPIVMKIMSALYDHLSDRTGKKLITAIFLSWGLKKVPIFATLHHHLLADEFHNYDISWLQNCLEVE